MTTSCFSVVWPTTLSLFVQRNAVVFTYPTPPTPFLANYFKRSVSTKAILSGLITSMLKLILITVWMWIHCSALWFAWCTTIIYSAPLMLIVETMDVWHLQVYACVICLSLDVVLSSIQPLMCMFLLHCKFHWSKLQSLGKYLPVIMRASQSMAAPKKVRVIIWKYQSGWKNCLGCCLLLNTFDLWFCGSC